MAADDSASVPGEATPAQVESALERWLAVHGFASWDPYDALTSPLLGKLQRWQLPARLCMQAVKRAPVNLRPWLGIRPRLHSKSLADLAMVHLIRAELGEPDAAARARALLVRLRDCAVPVAAGAAWGMDLPYVSRFVNATPTTPNLFQTVNAAAAFLRAYEAEGDAEDLALALRVVEFQEQGLGRLEDNAQHVVWRYWPGQTACIYNVNALIGAWLLRLGRLAEREDLSRLGRRTLRFIVDSQNPNGSWDYARGAAGRWVDGFHTGYILEALVDAVHVEGEAGCREALARGTRFYLERLFTTAGVPRYTEHSTYPIEVQNCAQAIQTLARLATHEPELMPRARMVTTAVVRSLFRSIRRGPEAEGYFMMSRGRLLANRLAAVRWGQAPMLLALVHLRAAERVTAGRRA